eukprot:m.115492 g.115492  ORF g.115492 m.115492 type:complete len:312 (+) comp13569_c0_seq1:33-968(+)
MMPSPATRAWQYTKQPVEDPPPNTNAITDQRVMGLQQCFDELTQNKASQYRWWCERNDSLQQVKKRAEAQQQALSKDQALRPLHVVSKSGTETLKALQLELAECEACHRVKAEHDDQFLALKEEVQQLLTAASNEIIELMEQAKNARAHAEENNRLFNRIAELRHVQKGARSLLQDMRGCVEWRRLCVEGKISDRRGKIHHLLVRCTRCTSEERARCLKALTILLFILFFPVTGIGVGTFYALRIFNFERWANIELEWVMFLNPVVFITILVLSPLLLLVKLAQHHLWVFLLVVAVATTATVLCTTYSYWG